MIEKITIGDKLRHFERDAEKGKGRALLLRSIELSTTKPNILIGPNGSCKTTLLETLAMYTLCHDYGFTKLTDRSTRFCDELWQKEREEYYWSEEHFMADVSIVGGMPFGTFISPDFKPCGALDWAHALCYGLGEDASDYFKKTDPVSSGQGMIAAIKGALALLKAKQIPKIDMSYVEECRQEWRSQSHMAKRGIKLAEHIGEPTTMIGLFDEPERCLDLKAQLKFWKQVPALADDKHQIVISTHSILPLLDPDRYNFIEMEDGYLAALLGDVQKLMK